MSIKLRVGTRQSPLAMKQTELVIRQLQAFNPELEVEIVGISTHGDRDQQSHLSVIGGKGIFVKEVERKLIDHEIDFAVHSLKDLPAELPDGLTLAAHPKRANPLDCLIFENENPLKTQKNPIRLGTGSMRREIQLKNAIKSAEILPIRGKIETRLAKLSSEKLDAVVLAVAGLERMDYLKDLSYEILSPELCIPAAGQGILAVECRMADQSIFDLLHQISDLETEQAAIAERTFLALMNGNCDIPLGALAQKQGETWTFRAFLAKSAADKGQSVKLKGENPVALAHQAFERLR